MPKLVAYGTAGDDAEFEVKLTAEIPSVVALRSDAAMRATMVLQREAQRLAEIAFVDYRDAAAEPAEMERIRNAPKDRSSVIVQAGTREKVESGEFKLEDVVQVVRGSVEAHGQTLTARGK
jgi:hypothetical protein